MNPSRFIVSASVIALIASCAGHNADTVNTSPPSNGMVILQSAAPKLDDLRSAFGNKVTINVDESQDVQEAPSSVETCTDAVGISDGGLEQLVSETNPIANRYRTFGGNNSDSTQRDGAAFTFTVDVAAYTTDEDARSAFNSMSHDMTEKCYVMPSSAKYGMFVRELTALEVFSDSVSILFNEHIDTGTEDGVTVFPAGLKCIRQYGLVSSAITETQTCVDREDYPVSEQSKLLELVVSRMKKSVG